MKICFILSRVPWPLDKGDKLRAYYQIKYLSANHDIILISTYESALPKDAKEEMLKYCSEVHFYKLNRFSQLINIFLTLFTKLPFQSKYFYSRKIKKEIAKILEKTQPNFIFCQLIRMAEYVKDLKYNKILDYQDALSAGLKRRMEISSGIFKHLLNVEFQRTLNYENQIFSYFDRKIIITENERDLIPHSEREKIMVIPNGVDYEYFKPQDIKQSYDIIFAGNMNYPPNIDAAIFLADKILPLVTNKIPEVKILIAGSNPSMSVINRASANVDISGWVENIADAYASAKIFVAPMQIGTGLQNKLLEAMAMKLPCITTSLANNALGAKPDTEILVGNNAKEIANHIINLLTDKILYEKIADGGNEFVKMNYSWEKVILKLEDALK